MTKLDVSYSDFVSKITTDGLKYHHTSRGNSIKAVAVDEVVSYECIIKGDDKVDFETNHLAGSNKRHTGADGKPIIKTTPFADKSQLFFRGRGIKQTITANSTENITYVIPYDKCKLNGIELLNGNDGDTVNFKVLDSTTGTYTTIPNYLLNQFGFDWNVAASGTTKVLPYDADLFLNMQISVEYTNNSNSDTEIAVNIDLHEDKS